MSVLTLPSAKAYLRIEQGTQDALLPEFMAAAELFVSNRCGPLEAGSVAERVRPSGDSLLLTRLPTISLTSVTPSDGGAALTLGDLYLDEGSGIVTRNDGGCFSSRYYTVVYSAGRATCPADLMLAVKEILRDTYRPQRGGRRPGSPVDQTASNTLPGAEYVPPFLAARLMAPYELTGP